MSKGAKAKLSKKYIPTHKNLIHEPIKQSSIRENEWTRGIDMMLTYRKCLKCKQKKRCSGCGECQNCGYAGD